MDILTVADGRVGVVVGSCTDTTVADRLRSDVRESLRGNGDPLQSLNGVDGVVVCGVIDATAIAYGTHGTSATAVVVPDRGTTVAGGRLTVCNLAPGATVLLSTAPIPGATTLLRDGASVHPDQLADRVIAAVNGSPPVAAVLYRHPPGPMTITLPAEPANLAIGRERLREWLSEAGVDAESCADVLLAAGEAAANATEHAVIGADHEVRITVDAALNGNLLALTVSDNGRWKPAAVSPGHRGHGMQLINALVDSVELTATPAGTTVAMLKELP